jgi:SAM-dependent methyltransferase
MDVREHNRIAWDAQAERGNRWTVPSSDEAIEAARRGTWEIFLTPTRPVPRGWLGDVSARHVLCLASGGGQQAPILAAAGAHVTVVDNSPRQLERDIQLARKHHLSIDTILGDMAKLEKIQDGVFDLIVHPVSNCFVPDVAPVWEEAFRVLRSGGTLVAGFNNPIVYVFDREVWEAEERLEVKYRLPYSDVAALQPEVIAARRSGGVPLEWSHTLEDLIGGQMSAGFLVGGLYEDVDQPDEANLLNRFTATYIATRATKPHGG